MTTVTNPMRSLSVIIPTLNEEANIADCLKHLRGEHAGQIIVADAGSNDETGAIAVKHGALVVQAPRGRAAQMNAGARQADADVLFFLHADVRVASGWSKAIRAGMQKGCIAGCFAHRIDSSRIMYRLIEASGNIRARLSGIYYGDQGIFVQRRVFEEVGGYDGVNLFEDVLLSQKLRGRGKTCVLPLACTASARRWEVQGLVRATLINWLVSIGFMLNIHPDRLKKLYVDIR